MTEKPPEDIESVASRSGRIVLYVQIGEGILLGMAAIAIIILTVLLLSDHRTIDKQQQKIANQQQKVSQQEQKLTEISAAQAAESARVKTALCDSEFTIASAPLAPNSSKLGTEFVESSRKAFVVLGCPGHLGAPPKSLTALGKQWGVPIRY